MNSPASHSSRSRFAAVSRVEGHTDAPAYFGACWDAAALVLSGLCEIPSSILFDSCLLGARGGVGVPFSGRMACIAIDSRLTGVAGAHVPQ